MRNKDISFFFLSQLILPPVVLALPFLVLYKALALLDTRIGIVMVYTLMVLPIVIWIMRDQFSAIPIELEEAALVDGLGIWGAFLQIVLPIALPGMVAAFILSLVLCWNEYFFAALLTSTNANTLPVMVASQTGSAGHQLVVDGRARHRRDRAAGDHRHRAGALPDQGHDRRRGEVSGAIRTRIWDRRGDGGLVFSELGFGSAPLGNLYRAIPEAEAQATLEAAWAGGVRYFDTAPLYGLGLSETRLNAFLRGKDRDGYLLSTKVGRLLAACPPERRTGIGKFFEVPSRREVYDYSYDGVMRSFEASLERLGVDRIDILYVHDLDVAVHGTKAESDRRIGQFMASGYDALVALRDQGVIRAFGGGINQWQVCLDLAERGDFDLFLLAGRYTLLEQEALEGFLPLCDARGIGVVLGGPYNSGILATGAKPGAFYDYRPAPAAVLERVGTDRGGLRRARRAAGRGGAAVPAAAPGGGLGDPGRAERRRGARQSAGAGDAAAGRALGPPEGRGAAAGGRADRVRARCTRCAERLSD